MKRFSDDLKRHATKIMSYEKREIVPLTNEENKSYLKQKVCYICPKKISTDNNDIAFKKHHKARDHCHCTSKYRGAGHNIYNLRYKTPKEIPVVFDNGSKYDYPL